MRILIVDDDYVTRTQLKALMSKYGDVDAAPNGELGLKMFEIAHEEGVPYRLIALDVDMPKLTGPDVVEVIRRFETERRLYLKEQDAKVMMITAMRDGQSLVSSFRAGCEGYLVKPVTRDGLEKTLAKVGLGHLVTPP